MENIFISIWFGTHFINKFIEYYLSFQGNYISFIT